MVDVVFCLLCFALCVVLVAFRCACCALRCFVLFVCFVLLLCLVLLFLNVSVILYVI